MITLQATQKPRNVLSKTGQTTSYQAGDDGDYEAGWWRRRLNANNKTRFVAKTIAGDNVILDYATRLMWKVTNEPGYYNWAAALIQAEGLSYAGFTDWKLPNVFELFSVVNFNAYNPAKYNGFNFIPGPYSTSTTWQNITTNAWSVNFADGKVEIKPKTDNLIVNVCREF